MREPPGTPCGRHCRRTRSRRRRALPRRCQMTTAAGSSCAWHMGIELEVISSRAPHEVCARPNKVYQVKIARTTWIRLALPLLIVSLQACGRASGGDLKTWQEEVRLSDGQVLVIEQKRRLQSGNSGQGAGTVGREAWLSYQDPDDHNRRIEWHGNAQPMVLNTYDGATYLIAMPFTSAEYYMYDQPHPMYVAHKLDSNRLWQRIPFRKYR